MELPSSSRRKVALVGATGLLGRYVWKALSQSGRYDLTILVRSISRLPAIGLMGNLVEVDHGSDASLRNALEGHDVLVSTLGKTALELQPRLFNAAVAAKVQRIIPSEFGGDLRHPEVRTFPTYRQKIAAEAELECHRRESGTSYTLIFLNVLLDWGISGDCSSLLLDPINRSAKLYDGGDVMFSTTTMATAGQAVVATLDRYDETANRALYIQDTATTQNELLNLAKKVTEGDGGPCWRITNVDTAELEQVARAAFETNPTSFEVFYGFATRAAFAEGYGGHFATLDNEMLGLEQLTTAQIENIVRRFVHRKK